MRAAKIQEWPLAAVGTPFSQSTAAATAQERPSLFLSTYDSHFRHAYGPLKPYAEETSGSLLLCGPRRRKKSTRVLLVCKLQAIPNAAGGVKYADW
jgi:hypothetical protein